MASAPHRSADDYTLFPPSPDPLAIQEPVWSERLAGSRNDFYVYSQPVVTEHSVIYRHKNIVYARSILTGEARWINDLGGRAKWQTWEERQYPQEGVLVQDGLVFTVISKGGPSIVALDEVTGQLRWAYGPMVASTKAEARMRFEAAPAGGPMTVYAAYVLDNIEGESHTDTSYGVIAFESTTGRILWQRELCRLAPGKFTAGFAQQRRNRIRSFTSPPLYHQGTVYYCTNAGAVVALDGLSGRIKWLMRYPYYPDPNVHDATRRFGSGGGRVQYSPVYFRPHRPMFWYNQRPLIVGERLYVTPVDTPFLVCLERSTGKVVWTKPKGTSGTAYFLGPIRSGELCLVYSGRKRKIRGHSGPAPVQLADPATGKTTWESEDLVKHDPQPVMKYWSRVDRHHVVGMGANHRWWHEMAARPFLTADGTLYAISFSYVGYPVFGWCTNMGVVSLTGREITEKRRYYSGELLGRASWHIRSHSPEIIEMLEELPHKSDRVKEQIRMAKEVAADTVPENRFGPFLPFSRVTFDRYGERFELRFAARSVSMVYDRPAVRTAVSERDDPDAQFAFAELCLAETRLDEAASLLKSCLRRASSEDLDFRALVKQQLFRAHKRLARSAIRARRRDRELENALGMSRTASTLPEEMETLFALADAYARQEKYASAARCLRSIVGTYGHHEYPVAPVAVGDTPRALTAANEVFDKVGEYVRNPFFADEMSRSIALLRQGLPVYLSTVSPLPKPLTVRAGELATRRLVELQERSSELAAELDRLAAKELRGKSRAEQLYRLWEFPGTQTAQQVLNQLFEDAAGGEDGPDMPLLWRLADAARVSRLDVPEPYRPLVSAPTRLPGRAPAELPQTPRKHSYADAEGINWLALERRGQIDRDPHLLFLGGR
ncbi:MAG: PQQ-binding-like beta-propeller repeat protein, partial [bacterium]